MLGLIYFFAFVGGWFVAVIPFLGGFLFIATLMLWYIPGIVFTWTRLFEFHEFGASPVALPGHVVMLAFYAALALVISWLFGTIRRKSTMTPRQGQ